MTNNIFGECKINLTRTNWNRKCQAVSVFSTDISQCSVLTHETYMSPKWQNNSAVYHQEVSSGGCLLQPYYRILGTNTVKWHNQKILWYFMKQRKWSLTTDLKTQKGKYARVIITCTSVFPANVWPTRLNKSLFPANGWSSCSNELVFWANEWPSHLNELVFQANRMQIFSNGLQVVVNGVLLKNGKSLEYVLPCTVANVEHHWCFQE